MILSKETIELAIRALTDMSWDVYISFSGKEQPSNDDIMNAIAELQIALEKFEM